MQARICTQGLPEVSAGCGGEQARCTPGSGLASCPLPVDAAS